MNCLESGEHLVLGSHPVTVSNKVNYKQQKFFSVAPLIAGEPYASQHTILYNSGKKPKFVGCKIRSFPVDWFCLLSGGIRSFSITSPNTHLDFQGNFRVQTDYKRVPR